MFIMLLGISIRNQSNTDFEGHTKKNVLSQGDERRNRLRRVTYPLNSYNKERMNSNIKVQNLLNIKLYEDLIK